MPIGFAIVVATATSVSVASSAAIRRVLHMKFDLKIVNVVSYTSDINADLFHKRVVTMG